MRKQIITALLTISVSVAIIAGCGTKKPLQTDNSVSSEQGSSVDEMEPSSDYSEDTPEAGTDPSGERENDGEGTASGTDMDAVGRELFKEVLDRYCDYATNGWDEDGEESYMFWHNTDGAVITSWEKLISNLGIICVLVWELCRIDCIMYSFEQKISGRKGISMIDIKDVSLNLNKRQILDHVSLKLQEGKIYGLVGNNGSGKTMLMKCVCGFIHPTSGIVLADEKVIGKDVDYLPDAGVIINGVEEIRQLLLSMKNDHKTIVIASHNAEDIQVLCDEVYEMENGKLDVNSIKQQI